MNFRIEFYFHRANRSAIRRSSSTSEMPISGFLSISRSRRIASVTPSSSSAHGLCSDLKSELARRARCFSESPKASFSMSANAVLIFSTEYSKISVDSTVYCQVSRKSGSERLCSIEQASKQARMLALQSRCRDSPFPSVRQILGRYGGCRGLCQFRNRVCFHCRGGWLWRSI